MTRTRERGGLLRREVLPDPGGLLSFSILAAVVFCHLGADPDGGYLYFSREGGPAHAALEGFLQAFVLAGPAVALYAGLRHLLDVADSLLPYFTVAGSGALSIVTAVALVAAI